MKVKHKRPPIYPLILLRFPAAKNPNTVFTFGDTVYILQSLYPDLAVHEAVHIKQQRNTLGALVWWAKYMISSKFRYAQELEAYKEQFKFYLKGHSQKESTLFLHRIAGDLSGGLYGGGITFDQATRDIMNENKI